MFANFLSLCPQNILKILINFHKTTTTYVCENQLFLLLFYEKHVLNANNIFTQFCSFKLNISWKNQILQCNEFLDTS